jgi:hypothetical protein
LTARRPGSINGKIQTPGGLADYNHNNTKEFKKHEGLSGFGRFFVARATLCPADPA